MIAPERIQDYHIKWKHLQEAMHKSGTDGCLVASGINLFYLTGVFYSGYCYLPAEGEPWFFVKRPNGLDGDHVVYIRKPEQLPELFQEKGIPLPGKLMLEADELTYTEYTRLQNALQPKETMNATTLLRLVRRVKTPWEIEQIRLCARQHEAVYAEIPSCYRRGMTDLQLQFEIERRMRLHGSLGLFRAFGPNMDIFMGSILAGENAEAPSPFDFALGGAGMNASCPLGANGTPLKDGMAVMVDMAGNYSPYMTDMTRVYSVGTLSDDAYRAHQVSIHIHDEIARVARPGTACADLYNLSLRIATDEGLAPNFMGTKQQAKFVGHGVGLQINELPVLTPRSKEVLEEHMVFALEPKFVLPGIGAVGIENTYLVTSQGVEKLTNAPEEVIRLDA